MGSRSPTAATPGTPSVRTFASPALSITTRSSERGRFERQEIYKIDGFISQRTPGASVQEQCEAAWALAALVEQQLRPLVGSGSGAVSTAIAAAFPDGSAQIKNIEFKPISGTPFFTDEGQVYQIDFAVQITAVI